MDTAEEFLATGEQYRLGDLDTEKPHPQTLSLSDLAQKDLDQAITVMASIDIKALEVLKTKIPEILNLRSSIERTWSQGGRIFMCGCGATGRLSLSLEFMHRRQHPDRNDVFGFMAGGDVALVHSLEGFEDFPAHGARHLRQLGFGEKDLLISSTEGGETPFVIGATEEALKISKEAPYFLYCNPDEVLKAKVERSRKVIENPKIKKINLAVGPMALTGSTRMQASTVLQASIGYALLTKLTADEILNELNEMQEYLRDEAVTFIRGFVERESREYLAQRFILYSVDDLAITVFTDTTERAPTFSLTPFSHPKATKLLQMKPSLSYVFLPKAKTAKEAWKMLLGREPRPLNWNEVDSRTGNEYLEAFDFGPGARQFRKTLTMDEEHSIFEIVGNDNQMFWRLQDLERGLIWPKKSTLLFQHLLLKMFINIHSTLIMGRLGRYKRNLMTWVYPTNGKLIDRATRFVMTLLQEDGFPVDYESVVKALFDTRKIVTGNDSIVLATYEKCRIKK